MRVRAEVSRHTARSYLGSGSQRQSDIRCRRHVAGEDGSDATLFRRSCGDWRGRVACLVDVESCGSRPTRCCRRRRRSASCERLQTTRISSKARAACFPALTRPTSEVATWYNVSEVVYSPFSVDWNQLYVRFTMNSVSLRRGNGRSSVSFLLSATPSYGRESVLHRGG